MTINKATQNTQAPRTQSALRAENARISQRGRVFALFVAVAIILVVTVALVLTLKQLQQQWVVPTGRLRITQLNIGQGDALLVQTPHGTDILIDAGRDKLALSEVGATLAPWNRTIEYVIATHDDADHIGGIPFIAEQYTIQHWIVSPHQKDTKESEYFRALLAEQQEKAGAQVSHGVAGTTYTIDQDVSFEVIHPVDGAMHDDINDDSVVGVLRFRDFSLLLTGDASSEVEEEWLARCGDSCTQLDVTALKVGHHGSRSSTSAALLQATTPVAAFISAGQENSYGHPHQPVLQRLQHASAQVYRTDRHGRIACETRGDDTLSCTSHVESSILSFFR